MVENINIKSSAGGRLENWNCRSSQYHDVFPSVSASDLPPMVVYHIAKHATDLEAAKMKGVSKTWNEGAHAFTSLVINTPEGQQKLAEAQEQHRKILGEEGWSGMKKDLDIQGYALEARMAQEKTGIIQRIGRATHLTELPKFSTRELATDNAKLYEAMNCRKLSSADKTVILQKVQKYRHLERAKSAYLNDPQFTGLRKELVADVNHVQKSL